MTRTGPRVEGDHLQKYDPRDRSGEEVEQKSPGERAEPVEHRLNRRRLLGLIAGPLLGAVMLLVLPQDLAFEARLTAGTAVLMAAWWMTEAIPIPVTALLPLIIFPIWGLEETDFNAVGASYGNNIIFLFMGGFMLALAMQRWNLHRRIALLVVRAVGTKPVNLIGGFMVATALISMWVSNTATAVMMLPIGVSVLMLVAQVTGESLTGSKTEGEDSDADDRDQEPPAEAEGTDAPRISGMTETVVRSKFGTALMLGIAYAASVASMSTIISTPPNALMAGYMAETHGVVIGFGEWMLVGVPIAAVMLFFVWFVLTKVLFRPEMKTIPGGRELMSRELEKLGPMSQGEIRVLTIFLLAAVSWVSVPLISENIFDVEPVISDAGIAMVVGLLLFTVPAGAERGVRLLNWDSATKLPWGVLLLFGGGLALSGQFTATGLSEFIGESLQGFSAVPVWVLVLIVTIAVMVLTEMTSNTATAATFLPVAGGAAMGIGIDPLLLVVPVTFAATCAFMLPVATPPNAIAYGSGYVTIGQMIKGGLWLNLIGIVVITLVTLTLAVWVYGITY